MSTRKSRILVVDDEKVTTRLLRMTLEQTGKYEVRAENDSRVVVQAALEFHPDLVVLDVIMPDMDGGDVAAALREDFVIAALVELHLPQPGEVDEHAAASEPGGGILIPNWGAR